MTATFLTNAQVTALAQTLTDATLMRAANGTASENRLAKLLTARIGASRTPDALIAILAAIDLESAKAILATEIAEADQARAENGEALPEFASRRTSAPVEAPAAAAKKPRAAKVAKPAPEPKAPKEAKVGKAAGLEAQARTGILPPAPDFTAPTHKAFLKKHAALVATAEAGDLAGLQAFEIKPTSSSPKALIRYRDRAILALQARAEVGA